MNDETDTKWKRAIKVELSSMEKYDVWDLVPRKQGMDIVRSICGYYVKNPIVRRLD